MKSCMGPQVKKVGLTTTLLLINGCQRCGQIAGLLGVYHGHHSQCGVILEPLSPLDMLLLQNPSDGRFDPIETKSIDFGCDLHLEPSDALLLGIQSTQVSSGLPQGMNGLGSIGLKVFVLVGLVPSMLHIFLHNVAEIDLVIVAETDSLLEPTAALLNSSRLHVVGGSSAHCNRIEV